MFPEPPYSFWLPTLVLQKIGSDVSSPVCVSIFVLYGTQRHTELETELEPELENELFIL